MTITFHIFSWYFGNKSCSFNVRSSRHSVVLSFSFGLFLNVVAFSPFGELLESFFIFLNRYVEGFVKINREFINPSLTCLIKQQLKQLNNKFLMNVNIVHIPIAIEQIVPNFSKEDMTWFFILSQGKLGKAFSILICPSTIVPFSEPSCLKFQVIVERIDSLSPVKTCSSSNLLIVSKY